MTDAIIAQEGDVFSVRNDTWTYSNTASFERAYQHKRNGSNISGADEMEYQLVADDIPSLHSVDITATNAAGSATATASIFVGPLYYLAYAAFGADGAATQTDNYGPLGVATQRTWSATLTTAAGAAGWTPTLGAELLVNGDFSAWSGDNPDGWTVGGESGSDPAISEVGSGEDHTGSGTGSANWYASTSAGAYLLQSVFTVGRWYQFLVDVSLINGDIRRRWGFSNIGPAYALGANVDTSRALTLDISLLRLSSATDTTFDSISAKALTLSTILRTVDLSAANVDVSCTPTRTAGTQAGLVLNLDSAESPANFIIAYHNGEGSVVLEKCVAGTYTTLATYGVTYSAGQALRVIKNSSNLYSVYYNGSLLGSQTISDAGIVSNTRHGLFSTYELNTFGEFSAVAV